LVDAERKLCTPAAASFGFNEYVRLASTYMKTNTATWLNVTHLFVAVVVVVVLVLFKAFRAFFVLLCKFARAAGRERV
jgi:hypothetical protein